MKGVFGLILLLAFGAEAHYEVASQSCRSASAGAFIKELKISYRLGANHALQTIDSVRVPNAKDFLEFETFVAKPTAEDEGRIVQFKFDPERNRVSFFLSSESADLSVEMNADDEGVALFGYLNTDGVRQASFFRCEKYPFL